jgi:hypothetical protein
MFAEASHVSKALIVVVAYRAQTGSPYPGSHRYRFAFQQVTLTSTLFKKEKEFDEQNSYLFER